MCSVSVFREMTEKRNGVRACMLNLGKATRWLGKMTNGVRRQRGLDVMTNGVLVDKSGQSRNKFGEVVCGGVRMSRTRGYMVNVNEYIWLSLSRFQTKLIGLYLVKSKEPKTKMYNICYIKCQDTHKMCDVWG